MDLSISEFAQRSGVSPHALRHWHQQGILLPAVVDAKTGYRTYTSDQLGQARLVYWLRQASFSLPMIRMLLDTDTPPALEQLLRTHISHLREEARQKNEVAQAVEGLLKQMAGKASSALNTEWMPSLPTRLDRLIIAFVGIQGGVGRTPLAVSTASMLHALGLPVTLVEASPYGDGALYWSRIAQAIGDPLPYPVVPMKSLEDIPDNTHIVFDSSSRIEDFFAVSEIANKLILCTRFTNLADLDTCINHGLSRLINKGFELSSSCFGVVGTNVPTIESVIGSQDPDMEYELGWQIESWQSYLEIMDACKDKLEHSSIPFLGVVPYSETHRLAMFTSPLDFRDHYHALGDFLGIRHMPLPQPPSKYVQNLKIKSEEVFKFLRKSRNDRSYDIYI